MIERHNGEYMKGDFVLLEPSHPLKYHKAANELLPAEFEEVLHFHPSIKPVYWRLSGYNQSIARDIYFVPNILRITA